MAAFFGSSLHSNLNLKRNMELGLVIFKLKGKTINPTKSGQVLPLIQEKNSLSLVCFATVVCRICICRTMSALLRTQHLQ